MNLTIDCGNTSIKLALFVNDKMIDYKSLNQFSIEMILDFITEYNAQKIKNVCISNNSKYDVDLLKHHISREQEVAWINVSYKSKLPIKINYHTKETLGSDRIALAVGASMKYSGEKLIIDCGTCITYDFVEGNNYVGGQINLGVNTRLQALSHYTSKLPIISLDKTDDLDKSLFDNIMGFSTRDSMLIGFQDSLVSELKHVIDKYKYRYPNIMIILTGGDMLFLRDIIKVNSISNQNFIDPYLLMEGLNYIIAFNEK